MTTLQKLALRMSEARQRLNEIAALEGDSFTDEIRNELTGLQTEYTGLEERHRAAIVAQGDDEARAAGMFGQLDGEAGERGKLLRETKLADYLGPATAGGALVGRAAELNAALEVPLAGAGGGIAVPWAALDVEARMEHRTFTDTGSNDGSNIQRPILQRLFGPGVADTLGVRIDSVPVGRAEWPLIATGVAPAQTAEGTAAAAAPEATFTIASLKPKKLTGRYEYSHEIGVSMSDIEAALRRDLGDAVKSQMASQIINGTGAGAQVRGFVTALDVPDNATAVAAYADYAGAHALAVDGIHATMETEVSSVLGVDVYMHSAGVYQAGSGESGSEALSRRSAGCMASPYVGDANAQGHSKLNVFHAGGANGGGIMRGDSVAAVWPTLEIVRDIYSKASQGVVLTYVMLWDCYAGLREDAYQRVAFDIIA